MNEDGIREKIRALTKELQQSLDYDSNTDIDEILLEQAKTLDSAFKKLLSHATTSSYDPLSYYGAALKAQNQFRQTAQILNRLKNKEQPDDKK